MKTAIYVILVFLCIAGFTAMIYYSHGRPAGWDEVSNTNTHSTPEVRR